MALWVQCERQDVEKQKWGAGSESDTLYFFLHPIGQKSVTWPQLNVREAGEDGLSVCVGGGWTDPWLLLVLCIPLKRRCILVLIFELSVSGDPTWSKWSRERPFLLSYQRWLLWLAFQLSGSFSAQPFFLFFTLQGFHYHTVTTAGKTLVISSELLSFFPPCPNYMFLVHNSLLLIICLSHEDAWCLHVPQALTLEGDLLIIKGKVMSESLRDPPLWTEIWCEGLFY